MKARRSDPSSQPAPRAASQIGAAEPPRPPKCLIGRFTPGRAKADKSVKEAPWAATVKGHFEAVSKRTERLVGEFLRDNSGPSIIPDHDSLFIDVDQGEAVPEGRVITDPKQMAEVIAFLKAIAPGLDSLQSFELDLGKHVPFALIETNVEPVVHFGCIDRKTEQVTYFTSENFVDVAGWADSRKAEDQQRFERFFKGMDPADHEELIDHLLGDGEMLDLGDAIPVERIDDGGKLQGAAEEIDSEWRDANISTGKTEIRVGRADGEKLSSEQEMVLARRLFANELRAADAEQQTAKTHATSEKSTKPLLKQTAERVATDAFVYAKENREDRALLLKQISGVVKQLGAGEIRAVTVTGEAYSDTAEDMKRASLTMFINRKTLEFVSVFALEGDM